MADIYDFLGTGFHFPVEADRTSGRFLEAEGEEDIRQAVHIILMTKKGERPLQPDFGCGIWDYVFGTPDFTSLSMMEAEAERALVLWEPRIRGIKVAASMAEDRKNTVLLNIGYVVRSTNNPYNLVYPFYLEEGITG